MVDGARLELAFHGCRPWVIPLYEPPIWGEMRESNSRELEPQSSASAIRPIPPSNLELLAGFPPASTCLQGRCLCMSATAAELLELAHSVELRSGAYHAPALRVELYQRSWCGDSNADNRLTRPVLFPLSYTSTKTLEVAGRIALPMICFAGRRLAVLATPPHNLRSKSGAEGGTRTRALDVGNVASWPLDDFRPYKSMERAARVELASSAWKAEAPAAIPCSLLAGDEGLEPS